MVFDCGLEEVKLAPLSSGGPKRRGRGTVHPGSGGPLESSGLLVITSERRPIMVDRSLISAQMRPGSQLSQLNL